MSTCTFFGHRSVPNKIEPALRSALMDLIENSGVKRFYIGNQGGFDAMAKRVLKELSAEYPVTYCVVLAYLPKVGDKNDSDTVFPEGIETVPRRFAISYRNKWMVEQSDYVVTYVAQHIGSGAAKFKAFSEKKGKTVLELGSRD